MSFSRQGAATTNDLPDPLRASSWAAPSPPARRVRSHRWRDPRLWLGLLLVLGSGLLGARLLAAADDTVPVWVVDHDLAAGMPITEGDLAVRRVHFDSEDGADAYARADARIADGSRVVRDIAAGELLPVSALSTDPGSALLKLPVGVPWTSIPAGLRPGDRVDVWASPKPAGVDPATAAQLVLPDAVVLRLGEQGPGGLAGDRQVLLGVDAKTAFAKVLPRLTDVGFVPVLVQREN